MLEIDYRVIDIAVFVEWILLAAGILLLLGVAISLLGIFRYWRVKRSLKNIFRAFVLGPFSVTMLDVESPKIPPLISYLRLGLGLLLAALSLAIIGGAVVYWVSL